MLYLTFILCVAKKTTLMRELEIRIIINQGLRSYASVQHATHNVTLIKTK